MRNLKLTILVLALVSVAGFATAKDAPPLKSISYHLAEKPVEDPEKRCVVDLRLPEEKEGFATLVWFHGGGLTGGNRDFPKYDGKGVAFVSVGYRLSPQVPCPVIIEDAAAAIAWTIRHIAEYGGDPKKVFIGGHSAGGYLTMLVGMDARWLKPYGLAPSDIAGIIPVSGQVTTHFRVKEVRGITGVPLLPVIDEFAPLHYLSKDLPPICLITGDRRIEFKCRVEENDLMFITLKNLEHPDVEFHELKDLDHGTVVNGAAAVMPVFIERVSKVIDAAGPR